MKSEDYKAIQDLDNVKIEIGSFDESIFKETKYSYKDKPEKRTCDLYTSELYDILHFGYSGSTNKELYVHFKECSVYKPGIYVEIPTTGMSSSGGKKHMSGHNPWVKYVKEIELFIKDTQMLVHTGSTDFDFLTKVVDPDIINDELQRGYAKLPQNVETIRYMCKDIQSSEVWCVTYSKFYSGGEYRIRILDINTGLVSEAIVTDHRSYRDGGTTYIEFELDGKKQTLFYPTCLRGPKDTPKILEGEVTQTQLTFGVDEGLYNYTVKKLGIILEVENDHNYVPSQIKDHEKYDR